MVVDGWTEDWYYPNLSIQKARRYGVLNTPDTATCEGQHALSVRNEISQVQKLRKSKSPLGNPHFLIESDPDQFHPYRVDSAPLVIHVDGVDLPSDYPREDNDV